MKKAEYSVKRDKKEWKAYSKENRKLRKQLIKYAKEYRDFDYAYILKVLKVMLQMQYNLHSRPKIISYDTTSPESQYKRIVNSLESSVKIIEEIQQPEIRKSRPDQEAIDELFQTIAANLLFWWD